MNKIENFIGSDELEYTLFINLKDQYCIKVYDPETKTTISITNFPNNETLAKQKYNSLKLELC
jgi:hypothetical protein